MSLSAVKYAMIPLDVKVSQVAQDSQVTRMM